MPVGAIIFKGPGLTKHGKLQFAPGIPLGFEDQDAIDFFIAAGQASPTDKTPAIVYSKDQIDVDPMTKFASGPNRGNFVQPDNAKIGSKGG